MYLEFSNWYWDLYFSSDVFMIVQWGLLLFILFWGIGLVLKNREKSKDVQVLDVKSFRRKNKTDLDVLYDILKKRREIRLPSVCQAFNVSNEVAMEWGKILESGNLAVVDYPGFGDPVIILREEIDKEVSGKNKHDKVKVEKKNNGGKDGGNEKNVEKKIDLKQPLVKGVEKEVKGKKVVLRSQSRKERMIKHKKKQMMKRKNTPQGRVVKKLVESNNKNKRKSKKIIKKKVSKKRVRK